VTGFFNVHAGIFFYELQERRSGQSRNQTARHNPIRQQIPDASTIAKSLHCISAQQTSAFIPVLFQI